MQIILSLLVFLFGTFVGSFLNVVIYRFNTNRTLGGRSHCPSCAKTLHAHELVPIFSFVVQRGKCTNCKAPISIQYPIVEFLTGLLFFAIFSKFQLYILTFYPYFLVLATYFVLIFTILIVIFFYDLRHQIIPNRLVYPFILLSFFSPFVLSNTMLIPYDWSLMTLISGPLVALPLFLLWAFSRGKWIGFGDVKLALGMGYLLGVSGGYAALMVSFWIGGFFGLILLLASRGKGKGKEHYTMKTAVAFAPFLIFGTSIIFFSSLDFYSLFSIFKF